MLYDRYFITNFENNWCLVTRCFIVVICNLLMYLLFVISGPKKPPLSESSSRWVQRDAWLFLSRNPNLTNSKPFGWTKRATVLVLLVTAFSCLTEAGQNPAERVLPLRRHRSADCPKNLFCTLPSRARAHSPGNGLWTNPTNPFPYSVLIFAFGNASSPQLMGDLFPVIHLLILFILTPWRSVRTFNCLCALQGHAELSLLYL